MRLIIEKLDGAIYAYMESEKHFKKVEPKRGTPLLDPTRLGDDCELSGYDDFHMVLHLKKKKHGKSHPKTTVRK